MRERPIVRLAAIGALSLLALTPSSGRAGDTSSAAHSTPAPVLASVDLAIVGNSPHADLVEDRVASWFRGQGIVARTMRLGALEPSTVLAPTDRAGVRVWITLGEPKAAQVFFVVQERAGEAPRYLVNDVTLDDGLDELGVEQLA